MTPSDSLPIQFWPVDEETFNEKVICGLVKQDCFCQPFNCDDEISLQFENENALIVRLLSSDELDYETVFDETFDSSLGAFSNIPVSGQNWTWNSASAYGTADAGVSDLLRRSTSISIGTVYRITIWAENIDSFDSYIRILFGDTVVGYVVSTGGAGEIETTIEVTALTDEIIMQLQISSDVTAQIYVSRIKLEIGTPAVIESLEMDEVAEGIWEASFVPEELASPALCNQKIALEIAEGFSNGDFNSLAGWDQIASMGSIGSGTATWSIISNQARSAYGSSQSSQILRQTVTFIAGTYTFYMNFSLANTSAAASNLYFVLWDGGSNYLWIINGGGSAGENPAFTGPVSYAVGPHSIAVQFTTTREYRYIAVKGATGGVGVTTLDINYIHISPEPFTAILKSDCIDLKESHDCTELISYSNSSDFDGIAYQSASPAPTFNLRVPAVFNEENNPQEQEDLELSNGVIVTIRSSIQEKRLLELGYMPNHMHRKVQKILMHETIEIDDTQWKKRDSYDANAIHKYNLKKAQVWLTKYNSVEKNTI